MASRNINLCANRLTNLWEDALIEWKTTGSDYTPFLTCTHRSKEEQDALYAQGRTTEGHIVTNAKGGESAHNTMPSKAFDIAFKDAEGKASWDVNLFRLFASIVHKLDDGIVWGGDWKMRDYPHFELPNWKDS